MAFWDTVLNSANASPAYGERLIPSIIDNNAQTQPEVACFSTPRSELLQHGFHDISWRMYANAINRTAHFIHREIGRSTSFETVMCLGYPDLRVFIVLVALIKTGHKALFSSYHNSLATHTELIQQTSCKILLHTQGFPISGILEKNRMATVCLPELNCLLNDVQSQSYRYSKTFEEAKHDPCFIVHGPGVDGTPKPIIWTHWSLSTLDKHHLVPPVDGRPSMWAAILDMRKRNYCGWPIFDGAAIGAALIDNCFNDTTVVIGPSQLATADIFDGMLEYANIDAASCLPSTLEAVAKRPDILAKLNRLQFISYVGGNSLSKQAGDILSESTTLYALMGSTEANGIVQHLTDREDWSYICINPSYNGTEMRPVEDLFELVYVKNPLYADYQGVFKIYPHLHEYSTQDVYSQHPTKPHHWKHEGRKDEMIIFQNGWKFSPMIHERLIGAHPIVRDVIVVGAGRDRPAAVIELLPEHLTEDAAELSALLDNIWTHVVQANNVVETYGQLERRYVIFATKENPFPVNSKGVVQRKEVISTYAKEIEELYASVASAGPKGLFRTERVA